MKHFYLVLLCCFGMASCTTRYHHKKPSTDDKTDDRTNAAAEGHHQHHGTLVQEQSWPCYSGRFAEDGAQQYFFSESDRCNGIYVCPNGRDERECPAKCIGPKYSEESFNKDCKRPVQRWQYDPKLRQCQFFVYGGCSSQENQFLTKSECEFECLMPIQGSSFDEVKEKSTIGTEEVAAVRSAGDAKPNANDNDDDDGILNLEQGGGKADDSDEVAAQPELPVIGTYVCDEKVTDLKLRTYYNETDRCNGDYKCENGADEHNCPSKCLDFRYPERSQEIADCKAAIPRWFWHSGEKRCVFFHYGGCADVPNMFLTEAECVSECKRGSDDSTTPQTKSKMLAVEEKEPVVVIKSPKTSDDASSFIGAAAASSNGDVGIVFPMKPTGDDAGDKKKTSST